MLDEVATLLRRHPQLIDGFNNFLPPRYTIQAPEQLTVSPTLLYLEPPLPIPDPTPAIDESALHFVLSVKRRYEKSPEIYLSFLALLEQYQLGGLGGEEVYLPLKRSMHKLNTSVR